MVQASDIRKRLRDEVSGCLVQIERECAQIGLRLFQLWPSGLRPDLSRELETARKVISRIENSREKAEKLKEIVKEGGLIGEKLKENRRSYRAACDEIARRRREIGKLAYRAFLTRCANRDKFRPMFQDVLDLDDQIEDIQDEKDRINSEGRGKGFFGMVKAAGKSALKEASLIRKDRQRAAALSGVGEKVIESAFDEEVFDDELSGVLRQIRAKRRSLDELNESADVLHKEQSLISDEMNALGARDSAERAVERLDRRVKADLEEMERILAVAGALFAAQKPTPPTGDDEIALRLSAVERLKAQANARQAELDGMTFVSAPEPPVSGRPGPAKNRRG
jgi:archaellum component FlaC